MRGVRFIALMWKVGFVKSLIYTYYGKLDILKIWNYIFKLNLEILICTHKILST